MPTRRTVLLGAALAPAALAPAPALAQTLAEALGVGPPAARLLDPRWTASGEAEAPELPGYAWVLDRRLRPGADGIMRVAYAEAAAAGDRAALLEAVATLEAADPAALSPEARFAFWSDLYNLLTLALVLEAWPVASIRDVRGGLLRRGPWREPVTRVAGAELSLDDIEHGILRPVSGDPRVHYAVNCAALGCPNLRPRPWVEAARKGRLSEALDAAARAFVNHPRGVRTNGATLVVSSIYHWFKADFGGDDAGVIAHLRALAAPELAQALTRVRRIDGHVYDWAINAA